MILNRINMKYTFRGIGLKSFFIVFCCSSINVVLFAQQLLTEEEAIQMTIENNYGIQIAKNNIAIAQNNTSKENTGYYPSIVGSAASNMNLGGSNQKFSSGNEASTANAFSYGGNASLRVNYTLLDKSRGLNLEQLKEILDLSDLELRQAMELNILQLIRSYYQVAQLTETILLLDQTIEVSNQRLERVKYQYEYGQRIRLDVLNAEVDVQRDSINYFNTLQQLENARRSLNVIMGIDVTSTFLIDTSVLYAPNLALDQLLENGVHENVDFLMNLKNLDIRRLDLDIIDAGRKPVLSANAAYTYSFQDNPSTSFSTFSTNRGLGVGVNLSWNLFDGGLRKVREQNTQIAIQSQLIQQQQLEQEIRRDITNAWESYQNALFILRSEKINLSTNRLNFQRTEEQFKIGQVTSVEFRQAQLNLLTASTNYAAAKYDAKVIEMEMLQLAGRLLQ